MHSHIPSTTMMPYNRKAERTIEKKQMFEMERHMGKVDAVKVDAVVIVFAAVSIAEEDSSG